MRLIDADALPIKFDGHTVSVWKNDIDVAPTVNPYEWISVKYRLPEIAETKQAWKNVYRKSNRVLCACKQADGKQFVKEGYMEFFNDNPEPNWKIPGTIHSVTHWMPLPPPPKTEED